MKKMFTIKKAGIIALLLSSSVLVGCAQSGISGTSYSRGDARAAQQVQMGVVEAVTPVMIEADGLSGQGLLGAGAGAIVGGVLGNKVGGGSGRQIATVAGAVGGGIAGQHAERAIQKQRGQEITVRLDSGRVISVVQGENQGQMILPGSRVRVLTHNGVMRVSL